MNLTTTRLSGGYKSTPTRKIKLFRMA